MFVPRSFVVVLDGVSRVLSGIRSIRKFCISAPAPSTARVVVGYNCEKLD